MSAESDGRVLAAYLVHRVGPIEHIEHEHTPWHSATFAGARHRISGIVTSTFDRAAFERDLPEADIPLPGSFVADAHVQSVEGRRIVVEFLAIESD
jgi:hypothetical protein